MNEDMESSRGTWSEVGLARGARDELGKERVWLRLTNALSSLARTRVGWWLD